MGRQSSKLAKDKKQRDSRGKIEEGGGEMPIREEDWFLALIPEPGQQGLQERIDDASLRELFHKRLQ